MVSTIGRGCGCEVPVGAPPVWAKAAAAMRTEGSGIKRERCFIPIVLQVRRRLSTLSTAAEHIDRKSNDAEVEDERRETMERNDAPDVRRFDIRVRHLEGHTQARSEIDEVPVIGFLGAGETDPSAIAAVTIAAFVEQVRIVQRVDEI